MKVVHKNSTESMSSLWRHILHRSLPKQRNILGGELVTLPVGDARGGDGIFGPARVDASDTEPLPPCRGLTREVIWRQTKLLGTCLEQHPIRIQR